MKYLDYELIQQKDREDAHEDFKEELQDVETNDANEKGEGDAALIAELKSANIESTQKMFENSV